MTDDVERTDRTAVVLYQISRERGRQDARWGEQNHPDGTGGGNTAAAAAGARLACNLAAKDGSVTWRDILREEVAEAFAETDPAKLRAELVQVAAVAAAWIEAIDRRTGEGTGPVGPDTAETREAREPDSATVALYSRQAGSLGIGREGVPGWAWYDAYSSVHADDLVAEHGWRRVSGWSDSDDGTGRLIAAVERATESAAPLPPVRDLAAELVDRGDGWHVSPDNPTCG